MGMYVNVCGSVPCPALCEVRSCCPSFFAVLGMALSFLLPPTSFWEHDSNLRDQDAAHKNCLRNRGATVVDKGEQPSGHCHKHTEGMHGCLWLPEKVPHAQLCPTVEVEL